MKFNLTKYFMISRRKHRFIASHSGIASVDNWGGGEIFINCVLYHQFLLKSIVFKVCEHEYMNIRPSIIDALRY